MKYKVKFKGLDEFLNGFAKELEERVDSGFQESIGYLVAVGEPIVPIDTGALRESVYMNRIDWNKYNYGYYAVNPSTDFVYSHWREFVYPEIKGGAQPYLATILRVYSDNALKVFIEEVIR